MVVLFVDRQSAVERAVAEVGRAVAEVDRVVAEVERVVAEVERVACVAWLFSGKVD